MALIGARVPLDNVDRGARIEYHSTSSRRIVDVTTSGLRGAGVTLPVGPLRQTGTWIAGSSLELSSDSCALLPPIAGGTAEIAGYNPCPASRTLILRVARLRGDVGSANLDDMGFVPPSITPPHRSGPMMVGELRTPARMAGAEQQGATSR